MANRSMEDIFKEAGVHEYQYGLFGFEAETARVNHIIIRDCLDEIRGKCETSPTPPGEK